MIFIFRNFYFKERILSFSVKGKDFKKGFFSVKREKNKAREKKKINQLKDIYYFVILW